MAGEDIAHSRKPRDDLTAEFVRTILEYNPDTGALSWKHRSDRRNSFAGKPISGVSARGYIRVNICGHRYYAHRIIWGFMTGAWPSAQIDHISGVRNDNSWNNLREATNAENCRNAKVSNRNTSGERGVSWDIQHKKWRAQIMLNGKRKCLGVFTDVKAASAAYQKASAEFFGEFRRHRHVSPAS